VSLVAARALIESDGAVSKKLKFRSLAFKREDRVPGEVRTGNQGVLHASFLAAVAHL
jgi:hypothetical protein